ncbi:hypothetical protein Pmar_PMAR012363 [Perkinsus marinus ATCC 50983]|uniref:Uncharacterized protein n=1 Tax=Perkinsus marinus (strain ATCC 50983 / TXsc) TaxID=423536 RepID=C5K752_PERM5|nr:hypothetical protein Pmar_PMAR012363 [Perkinsus marinus ATCC 50983]EER19387.1 hypothetical protein Pmar_PMAR012363 [Perkinsus marinus ATCC 50983]|eukprot:XP_002787591.1 hypothetical protein Pmar_PMAR012363 [Perkinsus marinus ATCC 50983]
MASSVAEAPSSSSSLRKNVASPPPLVDDDEDDDEFSRLLNAHKKARDDGGGAPPRQTQSSTVDGSARKPPGKRQRVVGYGDIDGAGARRYTSENPRRRGGRAMPVSQREHTAMGLVPPRPLRFPFPPYCGPLAKLVSSGPPPPLPADEKSVMMKEMLDRIQFLTEENERLTWIVSDQKRLLRNDGDGRASMPPPFGAPPPPGGHRHRREDESDRPSIEASDVVAPADQATVLPPWRSKKTPTSSLPHTGEDLLTAPTEEHKTATTRKEAAPEGHPSPPHSTV